ERAIGPGRDQAAATDQEDIRAHPLADPSVGGHAKDLIRAIPRRPCLLDPPAPVVERLVSEQWVLRIRDYRTEAAGAASGRRLWQRPGGHPERGAGSAIGSRRKAARERNPEADVASIGDSARLAQPLDGRRVRQVARVKVEAQRAGRATHTFEM